MTIFSRLTDVQLRHIHDEYIAWRQSGALTQDSILRIVMIQANIKDAVDIPTIVAPLLSELIKRHDLSFKEIDDIFLDSKDMGDAAQKMFRVAHKWR